jgi:hypothetical protein
MARMGDAKSPRLKAAPEARENRSLRDEERASPPRKNMFYLSKSIYLSVYSNRKGRQIFIFESPYF